MANILAWSLLALGIGHIFYGLVKFREPVAEAIAEGFINKFKTPEVRRTALWFLMFGFLLVFAGNAATHAVVNADFLLLRLVGFYLLATSLIGLAALPKSPFLLGAIHSLLLIAAGYGLF
jgi:hypothetical protein